MSATVRPVSSGVPAGLCQCGCGQPTNPARQTDTSKGYRKGQPVRFRLGHALRLLPPNRPHKEVSTSVLRAAFERSHMTASEVALVLGWYDHGCADGNRFNRAIGLKPEDHGRGYGKKYRQTTSYDRAVEIITAMNFDPVDFDL